MANAKNVMIVVFVALCLLLVAGLFGSPFILKGYRIYTGRKWVAQQVQQINKQTADQAWLDKELKSLKWQNKWLSNSMILMRNDMWVVYSGKCGADDWHMDTIFIAKASNGKWYMTPYHFCENNCSKTIRQSVSSDNLQEFVSRYELKEFGGDPKNCFRD